MTRAAGPPPEPAPSPPPALRAATAERYRELVAAASGRVLELPDADLDAALAAESDRGARYDTVLSFMRTPQAADLSGLVAAIGRILADDGWIHMIEPDGISTAGGLGRSLVLRPRRRASAAPGSSGRDVVSALRAGGFTVTDLHRREAASVPRRWRRYVELRARRETPRRVDPTAAPGSEATDEQ